jgi:hypothetical protein
MTDPTPGTPAGNEFSHLENDLLPLLADLDSLAQADRAADGTFEDRLVQATLGALHGVQPVNAQVAELGAIDRAAAPHDLEQNVYDSSAPALQESAAPRLVLHAAAGATNERRHVRVARRTWWTGAPVRMAALVAIVAAVAFGVHTSQEPKPIESVSDKVTREMDAFFAAVEHASSSSDTKDADTAADYDPDKLIEWLSQGSAS